MQTSLKELCNHDEGSSREKLHMMEMRMFDTVACTRQRLF